MTGQSLRAQQITSNSPHENISGSLRTGLTPKHHKAISFASQVLYPAPLNYCDSTRVSRSRARLRETYAVPASIVSGSSFYGHSNCSRRSFSQGTNQNMTVPPAPPCLSERNDLVQCCGAFHQMHSGHRRSAGGFVLFTATKSTNMPHGIELVEFDVTEGVPVPGRN